MWKWWKHVSTSEYLCWNMSGWKLCIQRKLCSLSAPNFLFSIVVSMFNVWSEFNVVAFVKWLPRSAFCRNPASTPFFCPVLSFWRRSHFSEPPRGEREKKSRGFLGLFWKGKKKKTDLVKLFSLFFFFLSFLEFENAIWKLSGQQHFFWAFVWRRCQRAPRFLPVLIVVWELVWTGGPCRPPTATLLMCQRRDPPPSHHWQDLCVSPAASAPVNSEGRCVLTVINATFTKEESSQAKTIHFQTEVWTQLFLLYLYYFVHCTEDIKNQKKKIFKYLNTLCYTYFILIVVIVDYLKYKTCLSYFTLFGLIHLPYVFLHNFDASSDNLQCI